MSDVQRTLYLTARSSTDLETREGGEVYTFPPGELLVVHPSIDQGADALFISRPRLNGTPIGWCHVLAQWIDDLWMNRLNECHEMS